MLGVLGVCDLRGSFFISFFLLFFLSWSEVWDGLNMSIFQDLLQMKA